MRRRPLRGGGQPVARDRLRRCWLCCTAPSRPEIRVDGAARTLTWALQIPLLALIVLRLFRPRRPADQLSATLRRGRYADRNHARLRSAIAVGLFSSAVLILLMALLAGSEGLRVNG
jgi:hypothetical protein